MSPKVISTYDIALNWVIVSYRMLLFSVMKVLVNHLSLQTLLRNRSTFLYPQWFKRSDVYRPKYSSTPSAITSTAMPSLLNGWYPLSYKAYKSMVWQSRALDFKRFGYYAMNFIGWNSKPNPSLDYLDTIEGLMHFGFDYVWETASQKVVRCKSDNQLFNDMQNYLRSSLNRSVPFFLQICPCHMHYPIPDFVSEALNHERYIKNTDRCPQAFKLIE